MSAKSKELFFVLSSKSVNIRCCVGTGVRLFTFQSQLQCHPLQEAFPGTSQAGPGPLLSSLGPPSLILDICQTKETMVFVYFSLYFSVFQNLYIKHVNHFFLIVGLCKGPSQITRSPSPSFLVSGF